MKWDLNIRSLSLKLCWEKDEFHLFCLSETWLSHETTLAWLSRGTPVRAGFMT